MRSKEGYKEISIYLTDEQFDILDDYWRLKTKHRFITHAAAELLLKSLKNEMGGGENRQEGEKQ